MKKLKLSSGIFIIVILLLLSDNVRAQGAYVSLNAGYAFCMSPSTGILQDVYSSNNNYTTYEQIYLSLGKGFNFGGAFGYMFNKHIGTELGLSYLVGGKTEENSYYEGDSFKSNTTRSLSSNMFRFVPAIIVSAGTEKINPYAKFGLVIGIGSIISESLAENYTNDFISGDESVDVIERKTKMNGGVAVGINAAVGAVFELSDRISIFGELNTVNMSYAPTKGELIKSTFNDVDDLPNMTTSQKEFKYLDKVTYDYNSQSNDSEPSEWFKQKYPFGSLGINVGAVFYL